jgi:two-component system, OmpR family, sensor histidine kinase CpxA
MRLSLFTKILLWFFLNILALLGVIVLLLTFNQQLPALSRAFNDSSNAVRAVAQLITAEVREKTTAEREQVLQRYAEAYQVDFFLYAMDGKKIVGNELPLPAEILEHIRQPPPRPRQPPPLPNEPDLPPPPDDLDLERPPPVANGSDRRRPPPFPVKKFQTENPRRYWAVVRLPPIEKGEESRTRACLVAVSESRSGNGLFFDPIPWVAMGFVMLALSITLWVPFVRSLTKAIRQMTNATEQIAEENFVIRVDEQRGDEIGRLGKAINHLAARLSGFVHGQKRFLGDISHELNSPLARMQFALSILEDRIEPAARSYVADVQEEVVLMTKLVSELLAYSKAGMRQAEIKWEPVNLHSLVQQVVAREAAQHLDLRNEVTGELTVLAQPELLARAVGNVIRNAVRYAGPQVPIVVRAQPADEQVRLCIADGGPGVPEEALSQLFDPFCRLEADRARNTGGSGLGLAIVKTCIEACQGTVSARNRAPNGLEIVMTLQAA